MDWLPGIIAFLLLALAPVCWQVGYFRERQAIEDTARHNTPEAAPRPQ